MRCDMGFRYRKSINLGGGFRINLSKSGVGYSWGVKGYRVTKTAKGTTRKTASIPGTGISYVQETGKNKSRRRRTPTKHNPIQHQQVDNNNNQNYNINTVQAHSDYGENSTHPAIRRGMKAWSIVCYVFAIIYALIALGVGTIMLGMTAFLAVLGIMLTVLSKSPKSNPHILNKQSGMKKSTFVIICVTIAFCLFGIIAGSFGEMTTSTNGEYSSSTAEDETSNAVSLEGSTTPLITAISKFSPSYAVREVGDTITITCYMQPVGLTQKDFVIENSNDSIVVVTNIAVRNESDKSVLSFDITGMDVGKSTIKIKGTDGKTESNELQLTINEKDTSPTVYVTYYGEKYHFSASCAGSGATQTTQNKAINSGKDRCKKCG